MSGTAKAGVRSDPPTVSVQKARPRTPEEQAKKDAQNRRKKLTRYQKGIKNG